VCSLRARACEPHRQRRNQCRDADVSPTRAAVTSRLCAQMRQAHMSLGLPRLLGVRVVLGCLLCLLLRLLRGGALACVLLLLSASVGGCAKIVGRVRRAGWSGVEREWRGCEGCADSTMKLPRVHGSPPNRARWNPVDFNNDCHRWWPSFTRLQAVHSCIVSVSGTGPPHGRARAV
jgi:hypothetical protein